MKPWARGLSPMVAWTEIYCELKGCLDAFDQNFDAYKYYMYEFYGNRKRKADADHKRSTHGFLNI